MNAIPTLVLQGAAMVASSLGIDLVLTQDGIMMRLRDQKEQHPAYTLLTWRDLGAVNNPGILIRKELMQLFEQGART